jgi:hypothetical protein
MPLGLRIPVTAPRPSPRAWGTAVASYALLDGPEYEPTERRPLPWLNGVKFNDFGCERTTGAAPDDCGPTERPAVAEIPSESEFDPYVVYSDVACTTLQATGEELAAYAIAHTEVAKSYHLAAQVERAAYETGNPSLATGASPIANSDQSLSGAFVAIEDALADLLDGGVGMIHISAALLGPAVGACGLQRIDSVWYTPTGHIVVADAGYLGVSPYTGGSVAGELWVYGSGPVFYALAMPMVVGAPWENIDYTRNDLTIRTEQYGIAIFDTCPLVAAKIDTSDDNVLEQDVV